jgi:hypothetical protein
MRCFTRDHHAGSRVDRMVDRRLATSFDNGEHGYATGIDCVRVHHTSWSYLVWMGVDFLTNLRQTFVIDVESELA